MERDEKVVLEPWLVYHGYLFGFENLYVYDNGSKYPEIKTILNKYEEKGVKVNYSYKLHQDFVNKGEIFCQAIKKLNDQADIFFPLDCDEFVTYHNPKTKETSCDREVILNYLSTLKDKRAAFYIKHWYVNNPYHPSHYNFTTTHKTFFPKDSALSLDNGFHWGRARNGQSFDTDLIYFHYHYKPYKDFQELNRNKLQDLVPNFEPETLRRYSKTKDMNFHCAIQLLMSEEEYRRNANNFLTKNTSFTDKLESLGLKMPF